MSRERQPGLAAPNNPATKIRRLINSTNNSTHTRDLANNILAPESNTAHQPTFEAPSGVPPLHPFCIPRLNLTLLTSMSKINWSTFERSTLHAYRHAYRLPTPSAFTCAYNQSVLTAPGIGRCSPTMARRKDKRRVSIEQLALACRKDFNAAGVSEQECLAGFLYAVRNQGE